VTEDYYAEPMEEKKRNTTLIIIIVVVVVLIVLCCCCVFVLLLPSLLGISFWEFTNIIKGLEMTPMP